MRRHRSRHRAASAPRSTSSSTTPPHSRTSAPSPRPKRQSRCPRSAEMRAPSRSRSPCERKPPLRLIRRTPTKDAERMSAEKKLKELKIDLGTVSAPVANYVNAVRTGNLLYLAGKGPRPGPDGRRPTGKVGRDYTVEEAYQHARTVGP